MLMLMRLMMQLQSAGDGRHRDVHSRSVHQYHHAAACRRNGQRRVYSSRAHEELTIGAGKLVQLIGNMPRYSASIIIIETAQTLQIQHTVQ